MNMTTIDQMSSNVDRAAALVVGRAGAKEPRHSPRSVVQLGEALFETLHDGLGLGDHVAGEGEVALELDDLALALGDIALGGAQRGLDAVAFGGCLGPLGLGAAQIGGGLGARGGGFALAAALGFGGFA